MKHEDLRILRTKKNLEETFIKLLLSQNFSSITVKQICKAALTTRATFYKHYLDKYDLLTQIFYKIIKPYKDVDINKISYDPAGLFKDMGNPIFFKLIHKQALDPQFQRVYKTFFIEYYDKALKNLTYTSTVPRKLIAAAFVSQTFTFEEYQQHNNIRFSDEEYNYYFNQLMKLPTIEY